ncbi:heat-inducible transcriptional repressor HrcA [Paenibacillus thermoaerophilus]|uniref:Heat-inducible transcription repressor HrcA n=1 Tax=Paenibacillus thermoaerophilus TaxID=1215385 RepID=A0ABW2UZA2_9BACL|nr:heat-inducible transcriptional repressor HrcA [Paenibacillus thermoaerophilus]TMV18995.1 heat-inducible transcriptional repressor HrcA [Paenibacillus thermoaerophilus]
MLTERQKLILSAIVDDYIRSAEPVGSRSISKRGDVVFSPATIRNEMSDLEELGFLEQPHTSAGRIPSQKGYRYYVDHLVQFGEMTAEELETIKLYFAERLNVMEDTIQQAAAIISGLTNYTSIVLGPEVFSATMKHLQIVPLDAKSAVAIVVMSTGHVENRIVQIPEGVSAQDLERFVNAMNDKLQGYSLLQLKSRLHNEIAAELSRYVSRFEELCNMIENVFRAQNQDRVFLSGATHMLEQPEFKDVDKVKSIFELLEQPPTLVRIVTPSEEGVKVKIGAENHVDAISQCSLVTATYSVDGEHIGTIGVLGPTRMEYGKVIRLLNYLSKNMSNLLNHRWK